jgi:nucleoside-diphosphate-sugar epimerase
MFWKEGNHVVNIGTGKSSSLKEIVEIIAQKLKRQDISFETDDRTLCLVSDNSKMLSLGIALESQIDDYIEKIIRYNQ